MTPLEDVGGIAGALARALEERRKNMRDSDGEFLSVFVINLFNARIMLLFCFEINCHVSLKMNAQLDEALCTRQVRNSLEKMKPPN